MAVFRILGDSCFLKKMENQEHPNAQEPQKLKRKKIEGSGKIQAAKHTYHDLTQIIAFSLFGDIGIYTRTLPSTLPTFSGNMSLFITPGNGINNQLDIILPGVNLFFNLQGMNFLNRGIIIGRKFILGGCELFQNENEIVSIGDSKIRAEQLINMALD